MSRIRSSNTLPEVLVRRALRRLGFRFRATAAALPGKPDFILPELRIALFVHGCFWHCHSCIDGRTPKSNRRYWSPKLLGNVARDRRKAIALRRRGWSVLRVWACQVEKANPSEIDRLLRSKVNASARRRMTRGLSATWSLR